MEVAMVQVTAPADRYPDLQIPKTLRWWDCSTWTEFAASVDARAVSTATSPPVRAHVQSSTARIPEMVSTLDPESCQQAELFIGMRQLEAEVAQLRQTLEELRLTELRQLRTDLVELISQIPTMKHERNQLRTELVDLNGQITNLSRERDELLAAVAPLNAEVRELRLTQQEMTLLKAEIQALRCQKSSLDRELLAELRKSTEQFRSPPTRFKVHDS